MKNGRQTWRKSSSRSHFFHIYPPNPRLPTFHYSSLQSSLALLLPSSYWTGFLPRSDRMWEERWRVMLEGLWVALEETPETYRRRNNPRTLPGVKKIQQTNFRVTKRQGATQKGIQASEEWERWVRDVRRTLCLVPNSRARNSPRPRFMKN